jgi:hypothetical protein
VQAGTWYRQAGTEPRATASGSRRAPRRINLVPECPKALLRGKIFEFILLFLMAQAMAFREEIDPLAPQREAALFYGLFLRGHSAETLRRDIDVPKKLLDKMMRRHRNELAMREKLRRAYHYRKQVLAVFDELVTREKIRERIQ